ncbi:MAG: hypothetical protein ACKOOD_01710 [Microbacteriaceae bacterium]
MAPRVAKVVFETPLPQLNREFDYWIPDHLAGEIAVGSLVAVPFGRAKKSHQAFVVELAQHSEYSGDLAPIEAVVSSRPLLKPNIYKLCKAIATRQAVSIGDVLRSAVPKLAVRVDKKYDEETIEPTVSASSPVLQSLLSTPHMVETHAGWFTGWMVQAISLAKQTFESGKAAIICVPDFRDVANLAAAFQALEPQIALNVFQQESTPSEKYLRHLEAARNTPQVIIGNRSVLYAPTENLGLLLIWDDEDQSHFEQQSPYSSSREVALLRQREDNCALTFLSHSRSSTLMRLINIGYLNSDAEKQSKSVAFSELGTRIDALALRTIKQGLESGPVLIQVAGVGQAASIFCSECSTRGTCRHCGGSLRIDGSNRIVCRICNGFNLNFACVICSATNFETGRSGATKTSAELGKSFPGVQVLEITTESSIEITDKPMIVVSTPGIEPMAPRGYSAVVILDARVALSRDTLFAQEDAVRKWANALALSSPQAKCAIVNVPPRLASLLATWRMDEIAQQTLGERLVLNFPPHTRVASAAGEKAKVNELELLLRPIEGVRILGNNRDTASEAQRLVFTMPYSSAPEVSEKISSFVLRNSSERIVSTSGRGRRSVTIKMDDSRVL